MNGLIVDLFAGGGGASTGIEAALGRSVDIAINHNPMALSVHAANHPSTVHLTTDVWEVDPLTATKGRPVDLLWASPDCCHFSRAKGGKPLKKKIRSLAWVVTRWAKAVRPLTIFVENVPELQDWGPLLAGGKPCKKRKGKTFKAWIARLVNLGYAVDWRVLDASQYGAPTRRRRLFIVARCDGLPIVWPEPTHGKGRRPLRTAAECVDWSLPCPSIFGRTKPLVEKTMWRIAQGLRRFRCRVTRCVDPGHFVGVFQTPFCREHFSQLTPHKMASVVSIATFSVLDPRSRTRAEAIITNCRKYLAMKEEHETAANRTNRVA